MKWLLLSLVISGSAMASDHWRLFYIQTITKENVLKDKLQFQSHCTATLLNINNKCHLVTNAHCFKNDSDYAFTVLGKEAFPEYSYDLRLNDKNKKSSYDFFETGDSFLTITNIKKRFISKDLAELTVTKEIGPYCEGLRPIDLKELKNIEKVSQAYAGLGHYMSVPTVSFSKDMAWSRGTGRIKLKPYKSSLNLKSFYEVPDLTTYRGMSGGLLINEKKRPVGIITRNIPYQETSFIIGLDEVAEFLKEKEEFVSPELKLLMSWNGQFPFRNSAGPVGENGHGNGGENGHGNGGENGHGNGGENGHGNGGENGHGNGGENGHGNGGDTNDEVNPKLSLFRTVQEGIIDPSNPASVILSKCHQQIDGFDDYLRLQDCSRDIISRPKNGYPDFEVRGSIVERMFGNLDGKILKGQSRTPFYISHSLVLDQWQKITHGHAESIARIHKNSFYLLNDGKEARWLWNGKELKGEDNRAFQIDFFPGQGDKKILATIQYAKESVSPRGGTIYTLAFTKLTCDNKNYLKLICHDENDTVEFGLSKKSVGEKSLEFSLTLRTGLNMGNVEGYEVIYYSYGEMKVDEKGRLPDLPGGHPILFGL